MNKKVLKISIILISILSSCYLPINDFQTYEIIYNSQNKSKFSLFGKVDFSKYSKFNTKATIEEIKNNSTISLIYPMDHASNPNKTIATGLSDSKGNFIINPNQTFFPKNNDIYLLEAVKRIENNLISIRTYVKWSGTEWTSITGKNINLNSKTSALTNMISLISPKLNSNDAIETINISNNIITTTDIKKDGIGVVIISSDSINKVSDMLIDFTLSKNYDPSQYLVYQNDRFTIKEPSFINNIITTIAGNGVSGFSGDNGVANNAQLNNPSGIAFDSLDNMYIVDSVSNRIRKVDRTTGTITTIAGNGSSGFSGDNGLANNAQLNNPSGITFDSLNNMYIADSSNNRIRKVDKITSVITTIAGNGLAVFSGDNGQAISASLNKPNGIVFDKSDNMYIADSSNNRIRKVDRTTGTITTIAGNGLAGFSGDNKQAISASLNNPVEVIFDKSDNMYISDSNNNRIRKVDKITGIITTIAGNGLATFSGDNGQAISTSLNKPSGIVFDKSDNMYIADSSNNRIRKFVFPQEIAP
ncbi:MAG: hypothetical protein U0457_08800 [Candidatus Sericytochromatia bacterium]